MLPAAIARHQHKLTIGSHPQCCPTHAQGFPHDLFPVYMEDDDALLRASHAAWVLEPVTGEARGSGGLMGGPPAEADRELHLSLPPACCAPLNTLPHNCFAASFQFAAGANRELHLEFEATKGQSPVISRQGMTVGRAAACDLRLDAPSASDRHARLHQCGELAVGGGECMWWGIDWLAHPPSASDRHACLPQCGELAVGGGHLRAAGRWLCCSPCTLSPSRPHLQRRVTIT